MIKKIQSYYFLNFLFLFTQLYAALDKPSAKRVVATIPVGYTPDGIAITSDSQFAYVANNNNNGVPGGDTVSIINLQANKVVKTISDPSFNQPFTITINPANTKAYVTNSNSTTVSIINMATNTVTGTIGGFDGPSGMVITPDGNTGYVNNYGSGNPEPSGFATTVSVVNLNSNTIVSTLTVDQAPAALAITPDGEFVYVINYVDGNPGTGTIRIIRTSDNTVLSTRITGFSGPFGIAITPDGKYAYVTNFGSNNFSPYGTTVSAVSLKSNTIIKNIKVGIQPSGIAITPDGRFVYVSNFYTLYLGPGFTDLTPFQGTVNIIDVATNTVLCPVIIVGSSPSHLAISPNGCFAYVTNFASNNVSVINIADKMWLNNCN